MVSIFYFRFSLSLYFFYIKFKLKNIDNRYINNKIILNNKDKKKYKARFSDK